MQYCKKSSVINFSQSAMVHFDFLGNVLFFKKEVELLEEEGIVMRWKKGKMRITFLFDILFMILKISLSNFWPFSYCYIVRKLRSKTQKYIWYFTKGKECIYGGINELGVCCSRMIQKQECSAGCSVAAAAELLGCLQCRAKLKYPYPISPLTSFSSFCVNILHFPTQPLFSANTITLIQFNILFLCPSTHIPVSSDTFLPE